MTRVPTATYVRTLFGTSGKNQAFVGGSGVQTCVVGDEMNRRFKTLLERKAGGQLHRIARPKKMPGHQRHRYAADLGRELYDHKRVEVLLQGFECAVSLSLGKRTFATAPDQR